MTDHAHAHEEKAERATDVLVDEHRLIERMLNSLARLSVSVAGGSTPEAWVVADSSDFIAGFADACHHAKEEQRLFPMLETVGMAPNEGPISVLLADHVQGRAYNKAMRAAGERLSAGDESARQELIDNMNGYIHLLRLHIKKEDNALFPIANRLLSEEQQHELLERFDEVERVEIGEGVHEKYLDVIERVEKAVQV